MRAEALKKYFVLSADPYVVYNSPRLVVTGPEECWRIRLGIRGDIPMVVYVGGLGKDRYVPELIESVKFWQKPSVLVVAGYGRPGVLEELRAIVRQNSTSDQVFFVGHLPSILGLVQEAQLGVSFFSSDKRMLNREFSGMASNKIFEYLALGKPAVVSHNRETEEFMEKWQCGSCLNDCSPQGIAEAIKPFLIDNNLIKRAAQNAMIAHQYETHFEKRFNVLLEKFERII
jgi:glycosyltransferase involved in cell wall biosynthesis